VPSRQYSLDARVSSDDPARVRIVLERRFGEGSVIAGEAKNEFRIRAAVDGPSAHELNRSLLSELRREAKRTRLRAEWTCEGVTERFFDYVPKGTRTV
jgi:hypothetical protein